MTQTTNKQILTLAARLAQFGDDSIETIERELSAPDTMDVSVHRRLQQVCESMAADVAAGQDAGGDFDEQHQLVHALLDVCPWTFHPDYGQVKKDTVKALDELESQLPPWATGLAKSFTDIGAQLCTKDGRKTGNAVIVGEGRTPFLDIRMLTIVTDAGTMLHFCERELQELFHEPRYTMNIEAHPGVLFNRSKQQNKEEKSSSDATSAS